jgi:hypothetical protein
MNFTNANTADAGGVAVCDDATTTGCNAAIYLSGTTNATTLDRIIISGTIAEEGINGNNVAGLTLSNSTIGSSPGHCGDAVEEGCMKMRQASGTLAISNSVLQFAAEDVLEILNTSAALFLMSTAARSVTLSQILRAAPGIIARASGGSMTINVTTVNSFACAAMLLMPPPRQLNYGRRYQHQHFRLSVGYWHRHRPGVRQHGEHGLQYPEQPQGLESQRHRISVLGDGNVHIHGTHPKQPERSSAFRFRHGVSETQVNTRATGVVSITGNTVFGIPNDAGITAIALGKQLPVPAALSTRRLPATT